jgi:hypothetical protein
MFLVPLILQMLGKKQVKMEFSREELAPACAGWLAQDRL